MKLDVTRNCLGTPNRLETLNNTVLASAFQEVSLRWETEAHVMQEALDTA